MDRAQRLDEKNGDHLSCLLPELWSLNVKNGSFFVFSAGDSKISVQVWVQLEDLIEFFQKIVWAIGLGVPFREIFLVEI